MKKIVEKGDPPFEFVIEYGVSPKTFGITSWKSYGTLIRLKDMHFSAVLKSIETGTPFFGEVPANALNPFDLLE